MENTLSNINPKFPVIQKHNQSTTGRIISCAKIDIKPIFMRHKGSPWEMPALLAMILKYFAEIASRLSFSHEKYSMLTFVSAYGMLLCFPFQGYGKK